MDILLGYNRGHARYFCVVLLFRSVGGKNLAVHFLVLSLFMGFFLFVFGVLLLLFVFFFPGINKSHYDNLIIWPDDSDCRIQTAIPDYRNLRVHKYRLNYI